ncbi:c-type cytochrome [Legionella sp. PATHC038]|uniref:c-type cytochrome n=1 Tax=Legionella sheltonii TaxID=2992041 RepID=UPI0022436D39|nr:c-type cytochrome [Legionella sp. PATHC038]MCW8400467.1 c-type cytochrome [Legionella sp. PATHC038]
MRKIWIVIGIVAVLFLLGLIGIGGTIFYQISKNIGQSIPVYEQPINFPSYPTLNLKGKSPAEIKQIKDGELLVKAGDCITCHTNTSESGKVFAGGFPIQTPYGIIYGTNITPDKKTGIGQWNDSDFIKAMRKGISPAHTYYYPAFPYPYFNKVSTQDLLAIKAYLNAIPAVEQPNLENKMIWPFNWRFIQLGWRLFFFHNTGPYKNNPEKTPNWNRGAYLVEGLGHCGMCHTPSYYLFNQDLVLGAPIQKYNLAGACGEGYLAPDITQSALDDVPDKILLKAFTENQFGGEKLHGPMVEAVHNSLRYLPQNDLLSIIDYLKSIKSPTIPTPVLKNVSLGKKIYKLHCSVCHNLGANGAPKLGDYMTWNPLIRSGIKHLYHISIVGNASMPANGGCSGCSNKDIEAAVDYMVGCATKDSLNDSKKCQ